MHLSGRWRGLLLWSDFWRKALKYYTWWNPSTNTLSRICLTLMERSSKMLPRWLIGDYCICNESLIVAGRAGLWRTERRTERATRSIREELRASHKMAARGSTQRTGRETPIGISHDICYITWYLLCQIEKAVVSHRLTTSPCALVAGQYGWLVIRPHMKKLWHIFKQDWQHGTDHETSGVCQVWWFIQVG